MALPTGYFTGSPMTVALMSRRRRRRWRSAVLLLVCGLFALVACGGGELPEVPDLPTPRYTLGEVLATEEALQSSDPSNPDSNAAAARTAESVRERLRESVGAGSATLSPPGSASGARPGLGTPLRPLPTLPATLLADPGESATPVPAVPATPSAPVVRVGDGTPVPTAVPGIFPTEDDFQQALLLKTPGCVEDFWRLLNAFENPAALDHALVETLNGEFMDQRPDCVESGWDPGFSADVVCGLDPVSVTGAGLPGGTFRSPLRTASRAFPTMGLQNRSMLVHLSRMPFDSSRTGCWYYSGPSFRWSWLSQSPGYPATVLAPDSTGGSVILGFETCNNLLRILAEAAFLHDDPARLDAAYFGQLSSRIRSFQPDLCGVTTGSGPVWDPVAVPGPVSGCGTQLPTGVGPAGRLVVNWAEDSRGQGFLQRCWVWSASGGWAD